MAVQSQSSQNFIPIKAIRDGVIVLKDGSMRSLLLASSVNLALKSQEEQQATINAFQTFLNSLDFSIQIVVQSRRLDIRPYLLTLEEQMQKQTEPLIKLQTKEYIDFIRQFTDQVAIMKKSFVIAVPYATPSLTPTSVEGFKNFLKPSTQASKKEDANVEFEQARTQLEERIAVVVQGLSRMGIRTAQLGTEEAVELFYKVFNPGEVTSAIRTEGIK